MRITYKKYGILEAVKKNSLEAILMNQTDVASFFRHPIRQLFNETFKEENRLFKKNIKYLSKPFLLAFEKAMPAISARFDQIFWDLKPAHGIFISEENVIMYALARNYDDGGLSAFLAIFSYDRLSFVGVTRLLKEKEEAKTDFWISNTYDRETINSPLNLFAFPIGILLFMQFAQVEIKEVLPGRKQEHDGEKHKNETELKIDLVGCSWFTTIVCSEGFKVTGHFRLQPCGPELSERKLIWINDFEKHGYTRKARILTEQKQGV